MGNGNRPTPEFRREAVRLALTRGRTRRKIAEDLGIGLSTLTRWLSQERDVGEPSEAPVDVHAEWLCCAIPVTYGFMFVSQRVRLAP